PLLLPTAPPLVPYTTLFRSGILLEMARQTQQAIAESDVVIFLVDARAGVNAHDHEIARLLRKSGQRVFVAVNKAEGMRYGSAARSEEHTSELQSRENLVCRL